MTRAVPALVFAWPWDQTRYPALCQLSIWHQGLGHGQTLWVIPVANRAAIEAILGCPLAVDGERPGHTPIVPVPAWKGKESLEVIEAPSGWIVREHQKPGPGQKPKHHDYLVPLALVEKLWAEVWMTYPLHTPIPFARIAEDSCAALGITRFSRKTGTFDKQKFQGSRRQAYMPYYYHVQKILAHLGAVRHGSHRSTRLKDELPIQMVFTRSIDTDV